MEFKRGTPPGIVADWYAEHGDEFRAEVIRTLEYVPSEKEYALILHVKDDGGDWDDIDEDRHDDCRFEINGQDWLVLDKDERETRWEESLDNYLEECVLPEVSDFAKTYFDREAWKRDVRHDGCGHCLSGYDGEEHEVEVDGEWFFLFRQN